MCEKNASTAEHVPPKCIFPEKKDSLGGRDFRKQLITVPACDVHNTKKSSDDEYLLYVLTMNFNSNQVGRTQCNTTVTRAIKRKTRLFQRLLTHHQPITLKDETGNRKKTIAMRVDVSRFYATIRMLSRALYLHHYEEKWLGRVTVYADFLFTEDSEEDFGMIESTLAMPQAADEVFSGKEIHEKNKDVFKYQVFDGNEKYCRMFRLHFYDETRLMCSSLDLILLFGAIRFDLP